MNATPKRKPTSVHFLRREAPAWSRKLQRNATQLRQISTSKKLPRLMQDYKKFRQWQRSSLPPVISYRSFSLSSFSRRQNLKALPYSFCSTDFLPDQQITPY